MLRFYPACPWSSIHWFTHFYSYLKRIHKVDSTRCLACREDEESIKHFLLRCPSYAHETLAKKTLLTTALQCLIIPY